MSILVTGSSGFIGSAIAARLCTSTKVVGLDVKPGPQTNHIGDIRDLETLLLATVGVSSIIHTAALHAPHVRVSPDGDFWRINVQATEILIDAAKRNGIEKLVYTSSTSVYGHAMEPSDKAVWVDETLTPVPRDIYDETKLEAENVVRQAADSKMATLVLRMSRCFKESARKIALYRLYRGVDRRDVVQAHVLALNAPSSADPTYNIGARTPFEESDCTRLWNEADGIIEQKLPGMSAYFRDRGWPLPTRIDRVYAIGKAVRELGFDPQYDFKKLIAGNSDPPI